MVGVVSTGWGRARLLGSVSCGWRGPEDGAEGDEQRGGEQDRDGGPEGGFHGAALVSLAVMSRVSFSRLVSVIVASAQPL